MSDKAICGLLVVYHYVLVTKFMKVQVQFLSPSPVSA